MQLSRTGQQGQDRHFPTDSGLVYRILFSQFFALWYKFLDAWCPSCYQTVSKRTRKHWHKPGKSPIGLTLNPNQL